MKVLKSHCHRRNSRCQEEGSQKTGNRQASMISNAQASSVRSVRAEVIILRRQLGSRGRATTTSNTRIHINFFFLFGKH